MDKQARKLTAPKEDGAPSEAGSEGGSNEESDHEDKVRIYSWLHRLLYTYIMYIEIFIWERKVRKERSKKT